MAKTKKDKLGQQISTAPRPKIMNYDVTSEGRHIKRGQAAQEWLAKNPSKDYFTLRDNQEYGFKRGDKGLVGNIAVGVVEPFVNAARIGAQGGEILRSGGRMLDKPREGATAAEVMANAGRNYLTREEKENFGDFALRTAAGVGANFVPGGVVTKGIIGGGLGAIGATPLDQQISLGNVATGAALGGALGLASKGIGKMIQKGGQKAAGATQDDLARAAGGTLDDTTRFQSNVDELVNRAQYGDLTPTIDPQTGRITTTLSPTEAAGKRLTLQSLGVTGKGEGATAVKNAQEQIATLLEATKGRNLNRSTFDTLTQEALKAREEILASGAREFSGMAENEFIDKAARSLAGQLDNVTEPQARSLVQKAVAAQFGDADSIAVALGITPGNPIGVQGLDQMAREFGDVAQKLAQKGYKGNTTSQLTEAVNATLSKTARDTLNKNVTGYQNINKLYSVLSDVVPQAQIGMSLTGRVSKQGILSPLATAAQYTGEGIGAALQGVPAAGGVRGAVGGAAQRAGSAAVGGISRVPGIAAPAAQAAGQFLQNPLVAQQIGLAGARNAPYMSMGTEQAAPEAMQQDIQQLIQPEQPNTPTRRQLFAQAMRMTGGDVYDALKLADFLAEDYAVATGGKQTEKQRQFSNASQAAQQALGLLESGVAGTGKLRSFSSGIENFFGTKSPEQTQYESSLAMARGMAMNALAGSNISESEARRVADAIPELTDEPNIARQKLLSFAQMMESFGQSNY